MTRHRGQVSEFLKQENLMGDTKEDLVQLNRREYLSEAETRLIWIVRSFLLQHEDVRKDIAKLKGFMAKRETFGASCKYQLCSHRILFP